MFIVLYEDGCGLDFKEFKTKDEAKRFITDELEMECHSEDTYLLSVVGKYKPGWVEVTEEQY